MENEKVLRLRISAEKWGPKSKFGPDNSVDNRRTFPTHPGSTSGPKKCMHQLAARAGRILGWVPRIPLLAHMTPGRGRGQSSQDVRTSGLFARVIPSELKASNPFRGSTEHGIYYAHLVNCI